jgi:DDE superfamily endonuclease
MSGSAPVTCCGPIPSWRKKRRIRRQLRQLPPHTVVLALDETDLRLFAPLRSAWARRGEPAPVIISGRNARRIVFGALALRTGNQLHLVRQHRRAPDFQAFLHLILGRYRGWQVALLLDENPIHTDAGSQALAAEPGIPLIWLPKRSPHLNPQDHLWRHGKGAVCANWQPDTIDQRTQEFLAYLNSLSPIETLRKAGVLSKDLLAQRSVSLLLITHLGV